MSTKYFKVNGENHRIDERGNHFINNKCVNLKSYEGHIGDTHPPEDLREPAITRV